MTHRDALSPAVQHKTCQVVSVLYPYILNLNLQFNSVEKKKCVLFPVHSNSLTFQ